MADEIVVIQYFQIFWVLVVLLSLFGLFLGPVVFDIGPKHSHFLVEIIDVVEVVKLPQSKLAVVIVQTFLGDSYEFSSILEI